MHGCCSCEVTLLLLLLSPCLLVPGLGAISSCKVYLLVSLACLCSIIS
jgi:hypothetical protein